MKSLIMYYTWSGKTKGMGGRTAEKEIFRWIQKNKLI